MKCKSLSASSYNTESGCQLNWFIQYVLGYRGAAGSAAVKGNIVHTVLETLASIKKSGLPLESEELGLIEENYTIDELTEKSYKWWSEKESHIDWKKKDYKDCREWIQKVLDYNDGAFNPLNLDIVDQELYFSHTIEEDWARLPEGGYLKVNGFIDLVIKRSEDCYEILDWKTGARKDFNTDKIKTEESLRDDIQLLLYYWSAKKIFPEIKTFMVTIFYINDTEDWRTKEIYSGGPFPVIFEEKDLKRVEEKVRAKFEKITMTKYPSLNKNQFKCSRFCSNYKETYEGKGDIEPMIEYRTGQWTEPGQLMNMCSQTEYMLNTRGPEWVELYLANRDKK